MIGLDISSWIQALAAVAIVVLTGWTLVVLRRYAADTKRIAEASVSETENSQRPFLTVAWRDINPPTPEGWEIQNQGFGPALSVRFGLAIIGGVQKWRSIADIAKGDRRTEFHKQIKEHIQNGIGSGIKNKPFVMEYSSLAGVRYRTTIERLPDTELKTTFEKIT